MKKILFNLIILLCLSLIVSCDLLSPGVDITQAESAAKLKEAVDKSVPKDLEVIELSFSKPAGMSQTFTNLVDHLSVTAKEGDKKQTWTSKKLGEELTKFGTTFPIVMVGKKEINLLDVSTINYESISSNIAQSLQEVPEGYTFKGIGGYSINNVGFEKHNWTLEVTEDGNETEVSGGSINTIYYELRFETNKDGEIILLD